jgi:hypothetical protein
MNDTQQTRMDSWLGQYTGHRLRSLEGGQTRENEAWKTTARNSEINIVLVNSLIKSTQVLLSLLSTSYSLRKLQYVVTKKKKKRQFSPSALPLSPNGYYVSELSKAVLKKDTCPEGGETLGKTTP